MLSVFTTSAGDQCWRTAAVSPAEIQDATGGSPRSAPRKVVGQWLVSSSVPAIEISRTLRVRVHRVPEIRVEIPNAYQVAKTFKLHTDRPELLGVLPAPGGQQQGTASEHRGEVVADRWVRHEVTVAARSKQSVTWAVRVDASERAERALLFVTDEHDKIEETIELWLEISPMPASATESSVSSPAAGACMSSLPSLSVTTSPDLTVDARFNVIVNSVAPEWKSSGSDSGINYSVWKTLTGYDKAKDQEKPGPISYDQEVLAFAESNGAAPTYADVLWSSVPQDSSSPVQYIVHALAPDLSRRPKRLPSRLAKHEAYAALVAVYFRAMWQATVIGGRNCSIGIPPLGAGVFANDQADVRSAAVLAHAAYRASGGSASVSIALWSPDGQAPADMDDWQAAAAAAPVGNSQILAKLRAALGPAGKTTLLSRVPKAHTTDELSELLKAAAKRADKRTATAAQSTGASAGGDYGEGGELDETNRQAEQLAAMAKDFLAARKDKAQEKTLKKQLGVHLPVHSQCRTLAAAPQRVCRAVCAAMPDYTHPLFSHCPLDIESHSTFCLALLCILMRQRTARGSRSSSHLLPESTHRLRSVRSAFCPYCAFSEAERSIQRNRCCVLAGYYGYAAAAGRGTCGALLEYLCSSQFLHFNLEKLDS